MMDRTPQGLTCSVGGLPRLGRRVFVVTILAFLCCGLAVALVASTCLLLMPRETHEIHKYRGESAER